MSDLKISKEKLSNINNMSVNAFCSNYIFSKYQNIKRIQKVIYDLILKISNDYDISFMDLEDLKKFINKNDKESSCRLLKKVVENVLNIEELNEEKKNLSDELNRKNIEYSTLVTELDSFRIEHKDFKQKLSKAEEKLESEKETVKTKIEQIDELAVEKSLLETQINNLKEQIKKNDKKNKKEISQLNKLIKERDSQIEETTNNIENLKNTLKDTENELEKLNNNYKEVKKESDDCKNNLKIMEMEKEKLKEEKEKLKEENNNNKKDIANLKQQLDTEKSNNEKLKKDITDYEKSVNNERKKLMSCIDKTQKNTEKIEGLMEKMENKDIDKGKLQKDIEKIEGEKEKLTNQMDKAARKYIEEQDKTRKLEEKYSESKKNIQGLKSEISLLQEASRKLVKIKNEKETEMKELYKEIETLKKNLDDLEKVSISLEEKLKKDTEKVKELILTSIELQLERNRYINENKELQDKIDLLNEKYTKELNELQTKYDEIIKEKLKLDTELSECINKTTNLEKKLLDKQEFAKIEKSTYDMLNKELNEKETEIKSLLERILRIQKENQEKEDKLKALYNGKILTQKTEYEMEKNKLNERIKTLNDNLINYQKLEEDVKNYKQTIEEYKSELKEATILKENLSKAIKKLQKMNENWKSKTDIVTLTDLITGKLKECNDRIALLEHKNTELTTNCILAKSKKKTDIGSSDDYKKRKADELLEQVKLNSKVKNEISRALKKRQWNTTTLWGSLDTSVKDDRLNIGEFKKMNKVLGIDINSNNYNSVFNDLMEGDGRISFLKFKNWLEK